MHADYIGQFYSHSLHENTNFFQMSPLEFLCLPDPVFLATMRAYPLHGMLLIDTSTDPDIREVGYNRIPDDVWAEHYAFLLGFEIADFLDLEKQQRGIFLDVEPEVTRKELAKLSSDQTEEYIALIVTGIKRREALSLALEFMPENAA